MSDGIIAGNASTSIAPGHPAGVAHVRRYFNFMRYALWIASIVIALLAIITSCFLLGEMAVHGTSQISHVVGLLYATAEWSDVLAVTLGLILALSAGVPMGMYLIGRVAGFTDTY